MKRSENGMRRLLIVVAVAACMALGGTFAGRHPRRAQAAEPRDDAPTTLAEARARARLLHETLLGALRVMHRDFFREDDGLRIPSRSLEDVFYELDRDFDVELRWLAVNANAMHVDHEPQTEFERNAVKAIASGKEEFETSEDGVYRRAGAIRLSSQCLKCHAPNRTNTNDRMAGLIISMPLKVRQPEPQQ